MAYREVKEWLIENMFRGFSDAVERAQKVVKELGSHKKTLSHGRHINIDEVEKLGLQICRLEMDDKLQDLVLTVHHAYMHTLSNSNALKIIENHDGNAIVQNIAKSIVRD